MKRTYSTVAEFTEAVRKLLVTDGGGLTPAQAQWLIAQPQITTFIRTAFDLHAKPVSAVSAILKAAVVAYTTAGLAAVAKAA